MICQSAFASPGGSCAFLHFWTRRSVEVWVPSFSAKQVAGRTTLASCAVSVRKISCTTMNSAFLSPFSTWWRSGSESIGFSPMI